MAGFLNLLSPRQKASQKQGWKPEQVRRAGGGRPQTRAVGPRTRACGRRPRRQAPAPVTGASGRRRGRRGSSVLCRLCVLPWAAAWPRDVCGLRPASPPGSGWVAMRPAPPNTTPTRPGRPSVPLASQPLKRGLRSSPISGFRSGGPGTPVRGSPAIPHLASAARLVCFD